MVIKYKSTCKYTSQRWDDIHLAEFQRDGGDSASQCCQIVFVCLCDFLDESMLSQSFQHPGNLMAFFIVENFSQRLIAESADVEFAAEHCSKQCEIIVVEEIKPAIAPILLFDGPGYFVQVFDTAGRIINRGDKVQIPAIGCFHQFDQQRHAVNRFFQRRSFHLPRAVPVFHPAVVLKKRNIISDRLDTNCQAEFVIHFDSNRPHSMFDAGSLNTRVKPIAHFVFVAAVEFAAEEGGDLVGPDRMNGGSDNLVIDGFQVILTLKEDVGGVFNLHKAPMVGVVKMADNRTIEPDNFVQMPMHAFDVDGIGQLLSLFKIVNANKHIVEQLKINVFLPECRGQYLMSVAVKLQPERRPGRDAQITQSQFVMDEVKVIMQAFAGDRFEIGLVRLFIVPGLIRRTGFHRRKEMNQSGMCPALFDDVANTIFLAEILLANKFDFQTVIGGNLFGVDAKFVPQGFGPLRKVKNANTAARQKGAHSLGIADLWNRAGQYDSVKTGQGSRDFSTVSFDKRLHDSNTPYLYCQLEELSEKYRAA